MSLFGSAVLSGVAVGLTFSLLAFAIVVLYRSTNIANFAQAQTGTLSVFIALPLARHAGWPAIALLPVILCIGAALGTATYGAVEGLSRYAVHLNQVMRTLGVYLVMSALMVAVWAGNEPYEFPSLVPNVQVGVGAFQVALPRILSAAIAIVLAIGTQLFFRRTKRGLIFDGIAENRGIARLLGVHTRLYDLAAWGIGGAIAALVGVLVAPVQLLTTDMLDVFMLYAFAGAILGGGMRSLVGLWPGGILIGIVANLGAVYLSPEAALTCVFAILLLTLVIRPEGIFGSREVQRV